MNQGAFVFARLCAVALAGGCFVASSTLPIDGVRRDRARALSIGGAASYTGDMAAGTGSGVGSPGFAAGGRVSYQVHRDVQVSGDLAFGVAEFSATGLLSSTLGAVGGRASVRYNPTVDWFAVVAGVHGGALFSRGSSAGSATSTNGAFGGDLGVRFGYRISGRVEPVLSQSIGLTVWSASNPGSRAAGVAMLATELGVIVYPAEALGIGAFLSMFYGFNDQPVALYQRPSFVPSIGLRYTFGAAEPQPVR